MLIIKGGAMVTPLATYLSDLAIEDGKIVQIDQNIMPHPGDQVLDARDELIFPGFIDGHTHFDMDNGVTVTADDFASGTRAALAGGTTTVVDFATQDKGATLESALAAWHEKADGKCSCNYAFHMAITDWNERVKAELPAMFSKGVSSFKLYLAYDALRVDDAAVYDVLLQMKKLGGIVGVHCENGTLIDDFVARERALGHLSPSAHPVSRPPEAEAEAISRLLYIARLADWPVHIVHLSSALGLEEVRKARARGQKVYVESCPQYLLLDDSRYQSAGFEGAKYVCSPPLRKKSDQQALTDALRAGEIDTLATDHCSFNYEGQKTLGRADFSKIPNGLPGVEHRPALTYSYLVEDHVISLEAMCRLLSTSPAQLFGMYPRKGALLPGSDADIVLFRRTPQVLSAKDQHMRCDYTPYEGFRLTGCAATVILGGVVAYDQGEFVAPGLGRYVARGQCHLATR
ncbi:MAG: dihydropyrimidinase [Clostridia bacterium]